MKHIKTFSEKVMEGMANYFGVVVIVAILTFVSFMVNQTIQGIRGNYKMDNILDSIRVLDKNKVDKFTFGVYQEMLEGRLNCKEKDHQLIQNAIKELQEMHPRERGYSRLDSISFNIRNRAAFIWNMPLVVYANNTE